MAKRELRDGKLYVYCEEDGNWYPKYKEVNGLMMELDEKYFIYVLEGDSVDESRRRNAEYNAETEEPEPEEEEDEEDELILTRMYGLARETYLKKCKRSTYKSMKEHNTLEEHLYTIERQAQDMEDRLVEQYKELEGVTEELKKRDPMEWVGRYNSILNRVRRFVQDELIFV